MSVRLRDSHPLRNDPAHGDTAASTGEMAGTANGQSAGRTFGVYVGVPAVRLDTDEATLFTAMREWEANTGSWARPRENLVQPKENCEEHPDRGDAQEPDIESGLRRYHHTSVLEHVGRLLLRRSTISSDRSLGVFKLPLLPDVAVTGSAWGWDLDLAHGESPAAWENW